MRLIDADKGLISKIQRETGCNFITAQKIVDSMPTIEERKVGKWVIDDEEHGRIWHCHCSNCKKDPQDYIGGTENWWLVHLPDYCPTCGSKMSEIQTGSD